MTLALKQFTASDNLSHLSVLQNVDKILIYSNSKEYSYRLIFVLGIVYGSLMKIKCLYSRQSVFSKYAVTVCLFMYFLLLFLPFIVLN